MPDPRGARRLASRSTSSTSPADGYRLQLVDHPPAFDRDGLYGDGTATTPTTRGGSALLCRAALGGDARRRRPADVLHIHDWHAGPRRSCPRRARVRRRPGLAPRGDRADVHNLAYHGWTPAAQVRDLGLGLPRGVGRTPTRLDLLREASSGPTWSTRSARPSRARR